MRLTGTPVHARDDLGDLLLGHLFLEHRARLLLAAQLLVGRDEIGLELRDAAVADLGGAGQVAVASRSLLVAARLVELGLELLDAWR